MRMSCLEPLIASIRDTTCAETDEGPSKKVKSGHLRTDVFDDLFQEVVNLLAMLNKRKLLCQPHQLNPHTLWDRTIGKRTMRLAHQKNNFEPRILLSQVFTCHGKPLYNIAEGGQC